MFNKTIFYRFFNFIIIFILIFSFMFPTNKVNAGDGNNNNCDGYYGLDGIFFCYHVTDPEVSNIKFNTLLTSDGVINLDGRAGISQIFLDSDNSTIDVRLNDNFPEDGKVAFLLDNGYVAVKKRVDNSDRIIISDIITAPVMYGVVGNSFDNGACYTELRDYNLDFSFVLDTSSSMESSDPQNLRITSTREFMESDGVIDKDRFNLVTFETSPVSYIFMGNTIKQTAFLNSSNVTPTEYSSVVKNSPDINNITSLKYFAANGNYMIFNGYYTYYSSIPTYSTYFKITPDYNKIISEGGSMFTEDKNLFKSVIGNAATGLGATNIGIGVKEALENMEKFESGNAKVIILLTDGNHEASYNVKEIDDFALEYAEKANDKDVIIYTIGLGDKWSLNEPLLRDMAYSTGGKYFNVKSNIELSSVFRSISEITKCSDVIPVEETVEGIIVRDSCILDDNRIQWTIENISTKNHKIDYEILPSNEKNNFSIDTLTQINLITNSGGFMKIYKGKQLVINANSKKIKCNPDPNIPVGLICLAPPSIVDDTIKFPESDYGLKYKIYLEESILGNSYYINTKKNNVDDKVIPTPKGILY